MAYTSKTVATQLHAICHLNMPPSNCWLLSHSTRALPYVHDVHTPAGIIPRCTFRRAVYLLHVGPIERDNIVYTKCESKLCVKPSHLKQGTKKQYHADQRMHRMGYAFVQ